MLQRLQLNCIREGKWTKILALERAEKLIVTHISTKFRAPTFQISIKYSCKIRIIFYFGKPQQSKANEIRHKRAHRDDFPKSIVQYFAKTSLLKIFYPVQASCLANRGLSTLALSSKHAVNFSKQKIRNKFCKAKEEVLLKWKKCWFCFNKFKPRQKAWSGLWVLCPH